MTDNSYKLFASPPTPGTDIRKGENPETKLTQAKQGISKSANDLSSLPVRDEPSSEPSQLPGQQKEAGSAPTTPAASALLDAAKLKAEVVKGPWRLLRMLPRESRHVICHMLEIDPKKRAKMEDILADPWISETPICQQLEGGKVINVQGHTHTLEPPAAPAKEK